MLLHPLVTPLHKGTNGRRCGVENGNPVLLDDAPETVGLRPIGGTFVHQRRSTIGQRAIDDVAVTSNPTHIGGAPIHILVLEIEDVLGSQLGAQQVTRRGVQNTLGFAGRSAGVQDEQRCLRIHLRRGAHIGNVLELAVPPNIPILSHLDFVTTATDDNNLLDGRGE